MKEKLICAIAAALCLLSGCTKIENRPNMGTSTYVPITDSQIDHYYQAVSSGESSTVSNSMPAEPEEKSDRIVLVGDSRTTNLGYYVYGMTIVDDYLVDEETSDGDRIFAAGGEDYDWLAEHTSDIEDMLTDGCALVVNMGVNGAPEYHAEIADWCNEIAEKYKGRGVKVYFMSVNPVNDRLLANHNYAVRNVDVICFNSAIRTELKGVTYLDTYSVVRDDILGEESSSFDGLHYYDSVYWKIRDYTWETIKKE